MLPRGLLMVALLACAGAATPDDNPFLPVAGAEFRSTLPRDKRDTVTVPSFLLQSHPVTNREFLAFVKAHPQWRRGAVPVALADADYLGTWSGPLDPGPGATPSQPVTRVSWFAADAYCEALHARLPDWYEWELAAAASASRRDARSDPAWRQQVLDWYSRPAGKTLQTVQRGSANFYGLYDMHGLVWEWVNDFNSLLPADADPEKFCGSGALTLARLHRTDPARWTFASAAEPDARRIGAALGFSYHRLPNGDFEHSLLITLLDSRGRILTSTSKLIGDAEFQARLQSASSPNGYLPTSLGAAPP